MYPYSPFMGSQAAMNPYQGMTPAVPQMQVNQAMCGVVRYPMGWSYNAGVFPPVVAPAAAA